MNTLKLWGLCLCVALISCTQAKEAEHEEHEGEEPGGAIELTIEERDTAGIEIDTVVPRTLNETLRLPAEVVINAYKSSKVTPRITAQVVARHVQLGDHVETGQPLVTLSSPVCSQSRHVP